MFNPDTCPACGSDDIGTIEFSGEMDGSACNTLLCCACDHEWRPDNPPRLPEPTHRTSTRLYPRHSGTGWQLRCLCGLLTYHSSFQDADAAGLAHLRDSKEG